MNPRIYEEFERLCAEREVGGDVLEVGAVPTKSSLLCMSCLKGRATSRVGINLNGPHEYDGFSIVRGNANRMEFEDRSFDAVLCNATLEHDPRFWLTLSEIRRVARPGALIAICTPGFAKLSFDKWKHRLLRPLGRRFASTGFGRALEVSTLTFRVHAAPSDHYRFSEMAYRDVFFEGMNDVEIRVVMVPPRIIGAGRMPFTSG